MSRRDTESSPEPAEDLTSRTDVKRANRAVEETLARLSLALCEIAPRRLDKLELPDKVHETVVGVHAMKNARARNRQLGLVRVALRNADWAAIQERLRCYAEGRALPTGEPDASGPALGAVATWVTRLLGEGFAGLDAFLAEYPRTDRARLVDLVHRVDRSTGPQRDKAERKLTDAIAVSLASGPR